jgi:hypothetical protein
MHLCTTKPKGLSSSSLIFRSCASEDDYLENKLCSLLDDWLIEQDGKRPLKNKVFPTGDTVFKPSTSPLEFDGDLQNCLIRWLVERGREMLSKLKVYSNANPTSNSTATDISPSSNLNSTATDILVKDDSYNAESSSLESIALNHVDMEICGAATATGNKPETSKTTYDYAKYTLECIKFSLQVATYKFQDSYYHADLFVLEKCANLDQTMAMGGECKPDNAYGEQCHFMEASFKTGHVLVIHLESRVICSKSQTDHGKKHQPCKALTSAGTGGSCFYLVNCSTCCIEQFATVPARKQRRRDEHAWDVAALKYIHVKLPLHPKQCLDYHIGLTERLHESEKKIYARKWSKVIFFVLFVTWTTFTVVPMFCLMRIPVSN